MYIQHASVLVVASDKENEHPLAEANVSVDGDDVTTTSANGSAKISVSGIAGDRHRVEVRCPDGHLPPSPPYHDLFVRAPERGAKDPVLSVRCEPSTRKAHVQVKLEGGPNLPVLHLGREVGRTNATGETSVTLPVEPGEDIELTVDTSSAKTLHPQNPSLTFHVGATDESFLFTQKFTAVVKKAPPPKAKPPKPTLPVRLGAQAPNT
jgi:hypothetical protein